MIRKESKKKKNHKYILIRLKVESQQYIDRAFKIRSLGFKPKINSLTCFEYQFTNLQNRDDNLGQNLVI